MNKMKQPIAETLAEWFDRMVKDSRNDPAYLLEQALLELGEARCNVQRAVKATRGAQRLLEKREKAEE